MKSFKFIGLPGDLQAICVVLGFIDRYIYIYTYTIYAIQILNAIDLDN